MMIETGLILHRIGTAGGLIRRRRRKRMSASSCHHQMNYFLKNGFLQAKLSSESSWRACYTPLTSPAVSVTACWEREHTSSVRDSGLGGRNMCIRQ
ncbi:hypothetical protein ANN_07717 [Periplaneta americana]|uniref:Uncharacterized protein n=1 Tax=Periplaneta americana TaxID=6978 RepID=A0ABQ8T1M5_PERAM|nr:hypothetical protein ANN_07717 [Periplaneta americana]